MSDKSSENQPADAQPGGDLTDSEREELARLRAEARAHGEGPATGPPNGRGGARAGRWLGAVALFLVGTVLFCVAGVAVFVRNQVLDTDRYVATVSPLAHDPALQDAIAHRITDEIITRTDVQGLITSGLQKLEQQGVPPRIGALAGPISDGIESFLYSQVRKIVGSEQFAAAWDAANRTAHQELVNVLTGKQGKFINSTDTTISIDLGAFLGVVKERLVAGGFSLAGQIPNVSIKFTIFESADLPRIRTAVQTLDTLATWLPWIAILLLIAGVAAAPNRRRGLLTAALFLAGGMLVLLAALGVIRTHYLGRVPADVLPQSAAETLYDTLTRFLTAGVRTILVLALVVAVVAFLGGPSSFAHGLRRITNGGLDGIGFALGRSKVPLGPVPRFIDRYRGPIEVVIVIIAAAMFLFWNQPTVSVVLWLTVGTLAVVAVVEILARAGRVPHPEEPQIEQEASA